MDEPNLPMLKRRALILAAVVLVSLLACIPLGTVEFFSSHELFAPVMRLHEMHHVITQNRRLLVPWSPDLAFGHGMPFFTFYAPLATYVAEVAHLLGADLMQAVKVSFALSLVLSGLSMAAFLSYISRKYRLPRSPEIVGLASAVYVTAPYRMVDVYVRGSVAECWSFVFFPLILLGCHMLATEDRHKGLLIGSLSYAALTLSHNIMALYFSAVLCLYVLLVKEIRRHWFRAAILIVLGQALSAFFWVPALANMRLVGTDAATMWATADDVASHAVLWPQFFARTWEFGLSCPGPDDRMSFAIGWHIVAAVVLLPLVIADRDEQAPARRLCGAVLLLVVLVVVTMTPVMRWDLVPNLFGYIQFPWRLLAFTTLFGSIAVLFALHALARWSDLDSVNGRLRGAFYFSIMLLVLGLAAPTIKAVSIRVGPVDRQYILERIDLEESAGIIGTTARAEYVPKTAAAETLEPEWNEAHCSESHLEVVEGNGTVSGWTQHGARYTADVDCTTEVTLALQSYYFPGWRYWRNGERQDSEMKLGDEGFIHVALPSGTHNLAFEYGSPPWGRCSQLVSASSLVGLLAWFVFCVTRQQAT